MSSVRTLCWRFITMDKLMMSSQMINIILCEYQKNLMWPQYSFPLPRLCLLQRTVRCGHFPCEHKHACTNVRLWSTMSVDGPDVNKVKALTSTLFNHIILWEFSHSQVSYLIHYQFDSEVQRNAMIYTQFSTFVMQYFAFRNVFSPIAGGGKPPTLCVEFNLWWLLGITIMDCN